MRLLLQVARRYYEDGADQRAIAAELGFSRSTISRLLSEARERKVVRFQISHPLEQSFEVERQLRRRYGLPHAWVAIDDSGAPPDQTVGALAADAIAQAGNSRSMIALSNGTSVAAVVNAMPQQHWPNSVVTQMIGSVGGTDHQLVDSPELCRALARRLGGVFRPLPVPIIVGSAQTARSIRREEMVLTTLELAARSDIALVGVGSIGHRGTSGAILKPFLNAKINEEIRQSRAVAHVSGHHFDAHGRHIHTSLCDRTIAMNPERLSGVRLPILVAWGAHKVAAIHAVLQAGLGLSLATDEATARLLLTYAP